MPKLLQTNVFFDVNFVNPDLNTKNFGVNFGEKRFFKDILFSNFTPSHKLAYSRRIPQSQKENGTT